MYEYCKVNLVNILLFAHPEIFTEDTKKQKIVVAETQGEGTKLSLIHI